MRILAFTKKELFQFETYKRGLSIHLTLLLIYSIFFIGLYFLLRLKIESDEIKTYYQLKLSKYLVITMLTHIVSLIYFRWHSFRLLIKEYFTEKGSAYNLAIFRIVFFFSLGGRFLFYNPKFEIAWTYLPDSSRVSLPFMGWLIHSIPISPHLYIVLSITAGVLCWMVCVGLFTRYAAILALPFIFYSLGIPVFYGKMNHLQILLWVPIFLTLSPMSHVLSIDSFIKMLRHKAKPIEQHIKYLLPFKMIWLTLAIIYFFAGIIKLWDCGLDWALSDSMINQMQWEWVEHYDKIPAFRLDKYPTLAKLSGLCVIYFELLYFLLIIKPKGRIWALMGGYSFHKLCGYFMYIDFSDLRKIAITFIDWEKFTLFIKNKFKYSKSTNESIPEGDTLFVTLKKHNLKTAFFISVALLTLNFSCSIFKIHSFPFSSYPTYSGIVKDKIQIIKIKAYTSENKEVDVKQMGEKSNFRWENIRGYELRIAESFNRQDTEALKYKLNEYWQLWDNNVKGLEKVNKVFMYLETTSIIPEKRKEILKTDSLGAIYL